MTTLDELAVGALGSVVGVTGTDDIALRLMEMGLTPGTEVRVLGTAPLGDPIEFQVRGYRLSLRKCEAQKVTVAVAPSGPSAPA